MPRSTGVKNITDFSDARSGAVRNEPGFSILYEEQPGKTDIRKLLLPKIHNVIVA